MFSKLLVGGNDASLTTFSIFRYYLERHIELDGDDHGPLAIALVERLCGTDGADDPTRATWKHAEVAVRGAFERRITLWDAVFARITVGQKK
eukprot:7377138-Prymnesium_polylepis.2